MDKRTWIVVAVALVLLLALSACDRGDLAKDLTPIPTLPPGEEPALVDAIQAGSQQAEQGGGQPAEQGQPGAQGAGGDQAQLVSRGGDLFQQNCAGCHGAQDGAGPAFVGMAERAANRVEGMSAEDYIHQSIVDPQAFVVPGFQPIMPSFAGLPDADVEALVAYVMSESGGGQAAATPAATEAAATPAATESAAAPAEGDPQAGQVVFESNCSGCHQQTDGAGPAVKGMGERAATRVEGMTAEEYLHESIVDPHAYVVEGFSDIMPDNFDETLSEADINNLVAFLLTQ